jgi:hypothetical protein
MCQFGDYVWFVSDLIKIQFLVAEDSILLMITMNGQLMENYVLVEIILRYENDY